jgi:tetratricopeptide (TPR) repeat protein
VHARFPDDESTAFLSIALIAAMRPEDPDAGAVRRRAADLAMDLFRRNPRHPGAAHYLIHALDTPELAHLALPAARAYAESAPEAFHARHMPAHIFVRLGMWKDAIASCRSAWDASLASADRRRLSSAHHDFHSLDWIIEMSFERGRRRDADAAMKTFADAVRRGLDRQNRTLFASKVVSYMARTREWGRADELLAPLASPAADSAAAGPHSGAAACGTHGAAASPSPTAPPFALFEQRTVAMARARAASERRDLVRTRRFIAERAELEAKLRPFMDATQPPAAVARAEEERAQSVAALIARARGDDAALLTALRPFAERSKDELAAEGMAGGILAEEEIADVLLRMHRAEEALRVYEAVLSQHVGRAHALLGAARAAAKLGDRAAARAWYEKLVAVWSEADDGTPGLAEARKAVAAGGAPVRDR